MEVIDRTLEELLITHENDLSLADKNEIASRITILNKLDTSEVPFFNDELTRYSRDYENEIIMIEVDLKNKLKELLRKTNFLIRAIHGKTKNWLKAGIHLEITIAAYKLEKIKEELSNMPKELIINLITLREYIRMQENTRRISEVTEEFESRLIRTSTQYRYLLNNLYAHSNLSEAIDKRVKDLKNKDKYYKSYDGYKSIWDTKGKILLILVKYFPTIDIYNNKLLIENEKLRLFLGFLIKTSINEEVELNAEIDGIYQIIRSTDMYKIKRNVFSEIIKDFLNYEEIYKNLDDNFCDDSTTLRESYKIIMDKFPISKTIIENNEIDNVIYRICLIELLDYIPLEILINEQNILKYLETLILTRKKDSTNTELQTSFKELILSYVTDTKINDISSLIKNIIFNSEKTSKNQQINDIYSLILQSLLKGRNDQSSTQIEDIPKYVYNLLSSILTKCNALIPLNVEELSTLYETLVILLSEKMEKDVLLRKILQIKEFSILLIESKETANFDISTYEEIITKREFQEKERIGITHSTALETLANLYEETKNNKLK